MSPHIWYSRGALLLYDNDYGTVVAPPPPLISLKHTLLCDGDALLVCLLLTPLLLFAAPSFYV